jgi:hypothetical protein
MKKVLPLAFTDLGAQQVKNIKGPIRAYIVADWLTLQALAKERGVKFGRQSVQPKSTLHGGFPPRSGQYGTRSSQRL